jgi:hypothetical protein
MSCSNIPTVNYIIEVKDGDLIRYIPLNVMCVIFYAALTIMAMSCSLAVNECDRSPVILQKIMLRDDIGHRNDERIQGDIYSVQGHED